MPPQTESAPKMVLTSTMEDYLEVIYNLGKKKKVVRVKDIAKEIGVKMPTVTNMLKTLSKRKLIDYEKYEYLELTQKGSRIGRTIDRRHKVLKQFLVDILKVEGKKAEKEACKMEHGISQSTMNRFIDFMEFVQFCPRGGEDWLRNFDDYRAQGKDPGKCLTRMKEFSNGFQGKLHNLKCGGKKEDGAKQD